MYGKYNRCCIPIVEFRRLGTLVGLIHFPKNVRKAVYGSVEPVGIYQDIQDLGSVWKYNPCCTQRCVFYLENITQYATRHWSTVFFNDVLIIFHAYKIAIQEAHTRKKDGNSKVNCHYIVCY